MGQIYSHGRQNDQRQTVYAFVIQVVAEWQEAEVKQDGDDGVNQSRSVKDESHQVLLLSQFGPFVIFDRLNVRLNLFQLFFRGLVRLGRIVANERDNVTHKVVDDSSADSP